MNEHNDTFGFFFKKTDLHIAIIGGGKTCGSLLDVITKLSLPFLNIKIAGVCDIDPNAEGMRLAREIAIPTYKCFRDFFEIKNLDCIIELTDDKKVLLELMQKKPGKIVVLERGLALLLRNLLLISQERKAAEEEAILQKISSDLLFRQTNAAILVLNTDFTIADANEVYLRSVDMTKEEIVGQYCYKITRGFDSPCQYSHPELKCPMLETMRTGESAHIIQEIHGPGDEIIYSNNVAYPLKDQKGEIVKVVELRRDITEEMSSKWEKRLRALKADMKKSIQEDRMISLGKLVASCAHEINNPIQGMLTFTSLMSDIISKGTPNKNDLENFDKFLSMISNELVRCGEIVAGLLSFSRESPLEYKGIILKEVLESVITLTKHKMDLQNIRLATRMPQKPLAIRGNTNQLQQCFLNLIFNAMEAMPLGGELDVILNEGRMEKARIEIRDTGDGIPDTDIDHIFDPFFTTKEEGKGTGLGLSIVYGVTKNHEGSIKVKSKPGKGSSFILNFPLLK